MRRTRIEHILSALPPLATEERTFGIGSFVPESDIRIAATAPLFDHLVGNSEQFIRHVEAQCLGGVQVDDQLELGRLHDRKISGLLALEDPTSPLNGVVFDLRYSFFLFDQIVIAVTDSLSVPP